VVTNYFVMVTDHTAVMNYFLVTVLLHLMTLLYHLMMIAHHFVTVVPDIFGLVIGKALSLGNTGK